ncbi:MAG: class I SAM-dependent methyltransferase [Candidatus Omnitrophica bacterium]|nr:class I SAM-dependent methyltransferase [Candidatus Omnitrophota bacterium]
MARSVKLVWEHWVHEPWVVNRPFEAALRRCRGYVQGRLLDVGCGRKPYRALYAERVSWHLGVDVPRSPRHAAEVFGDAQALPFRSASFDAVLCTHVLVHLPEPHQAVGEMSRALKPDGYLILSARQMWHVYTPRDYYRFTAAGLRYLAERHGLEVVQVIPVGGWWARTGVKLASWLDRLNRRPIRWLTEIPLGLAIIAAQAVCACLDTLVFTSDDVVFNVLVARRTS